MRYKITKFSTAAYARKGDKITVNFTENYEDGLGITQRLHSEEITESKVYTHSAFCDFGNGIDAVFLGDDKLQTFLKETFPDAQLVPSHEPLFVS